ncbi:MAG: hypothetical protein CSB48_00985 [Proteobacteria bacterium]|nr:MAG: hypothetical protein CSB48_00985 [Pseudomonadota bacterium]PIE40332.1 MAG: hypothetical protein CSA51_01195 [Gammaproteobacteria bacterium]
MEATAQKQREPVFSKRRSLLIVKRVFFVSVLVHLVLLSTLGEYYRSFLEEIKQQNRNRAWKVYLKTENISKKEALPTLEKKKPEEKKPEKEKPEKEKTKKQQPEKLLSEQHNPMHNSNRPGSSNNTNQNVKAKVVAGKRVKQPVKQQGRTDSDTVAQSKKTGQARESTKKPTRQPARKLKSEATAERQPQQQAKRNLPAPALSALKKTIPLSNRKKPGSESDKKQVARKIGDKKQGTASDKEGKTKKEIKGSRIGRENRVNKENHSGIKLTQPKNAPGKPLEIPAGFLKKLGNMELLDDGEMQSTRVEEPFSSIEAKTIRMVNRYLARMQQQIQQFYKKPNKPLGNLRGIIRFYLDADGYLKDAFVFIGSGDAELDSAALDAVRRVPRYEVPANKVIAARYYSSLKFYYSSAEIYVEKAPWEQAQTDSAPEDR